MHRTRKLRFATLLVGSLLALSACNNGDDGSAEPESPAAINLVADVRLSGAQNVTGDLAKCSGVGRYVDLYRGAFAVVTDETGQPLATGAVTKGLGTNYYQDILDECSFQIRVNLVPRAKGYFLVIAREYPRPFGRDSLELTDGYLKFDLNKPIVPGAPY